MSAADPTKPVFKYVSPDELRFDPDNPRFGGEGRGKDQGEIQDILENEPHFARQLVDSLLENGYIDYEPLVVRTKEGAEDEGALIVVEGNRRLAAVRHILTNRKEYEGKSERIRDLESIPVLVFPKAATNQDQKEQRVYLGVRHLFGFRAWPAESKARFLDANVRSGEDLRRTMRELNIKKTEIRRYLVPYRLRKAAKGLWHPYRNQDFWAFSEGLNRTGLKEYIELAVDDDTLDVVGFDPKKLRKLLEFVYGVPDQGKLVNRRIRETRELSMLSNVLQSKRASAQLEKGRSLDEAALFIESPEESLARLGRMLRDLGLLLRGVLARQQKQQGVGSVLERFTAFETSVKKLIRDAKKANV